MALTAEELLAGGTLTHEVELPGALLEDGSTVTVDTVVVVRPLTVRDLQRIGRAARDDDELAAGLMIQQALVEPELTAEQVSSLPAGVARFLLERINAVSGIGTPGSELEELVQAPLARACYVLAKEFGWTPEDVSGMTIGQILLYLEMTHNGAAAG
jgi:hypothetical protein